MYSVCRQSYETPNSSCIDRFEESKDSVPSSTAKPVAKTVNKECSSSEEDDDDSSEESSDDERSKQQQAKKDSVPSSKAKPVAKTVKTESGSSKEDDEDDSSEESSYDEPSKQQQAKKATQASTKSNSSDSYEEYFDEKSEDEKPPKIPKKDDDVEMKDASVVSAEKQTATKSEKKMRIKLLDLKHYLLVTCPMLLDRMMWLNSSRLQGKLMCVWLHQKMEASRDLVMSNLLPRKMLRWHLN
ncbi:nucleolin 1-like isoform X3 [Zingiber officinale]|uniref:nucleolin 1-like isoform X3 n=1 Tax=Zingiber officinale TaxID=94328 RepID=UPI001C4DD620|nr:nucleolin 1-like isoform X3 [Zingiber officinale]XP_042398049.1 nucleolin 1-like isoform X3 [Zingiber officinale]